LTFKYDLLTLKVTSAAVENDNIKLAVLKTFRNSTILSPF